MGSPSQLPLQLLHYQSCQADKEVGYEKKRLQEFHQQHLNEAKFVKQYALKEIKAPGALTHTVERRIAVDSIKCHHALGELLYARKKSLTPPSMSGTNRIIT